MGGDKQTSSSSTGSSSQAITDLTNKLATGLSGQVDKGTAVFNQPLYTGIGDQTQQGVSSLMNAASNPTYANDINNTLSEFGAIASGQRMGANDSAWNAARDNVLTGTNAAFNANGRFGGGSNVSSVAQGLGNVELSRLQSNEARQMQAASALPSIFSAGLLPGQTQLGAGAVTDADALARRQAEADLYNRTNNAGWDTYSRAGSILGGTAGAAGTTTTSSTPSTPWWQSALGVGLGLL